MKVRFTKMHGAGNDFVVFDGVRQSLAMTPALAQRIADRHMGVGCDQILLVEPAPSAEVDFRYRIFNADGGEVEQCGNGARCFVRYVHDHGLTDRRSIRVLTKAGVIAPRLEDDGQVTVDMGPPVFEPARVPFDIAGLIPQVSDDPAADARLPGWHLDLGVARRVIHAVSMGNPHAVQFVSDVDAAPVRTEGPLIEQHARFPNRVNAGYLQIVDRTHARIRVWERGAGETLACGTGACAAAVAAMLRGLVDSTVQVQTRGGALRISWQGESHAVFMTGPAVSVFEGELDLSDL